MAASNKKGKCPACGQSIPVEEDLNIGDMMYCPECYAELEIVKMKPVTFKETDSLKEEEEDAEDLEFEEDDDMMEEDEDDDGDEGEEESDEDEEDR
ncbi:MAG TPA: hypothetical protein PKY78_02030 [Candidatus Omnitrophota bacterium]|nr:hypothetical protein [Candidatus Omnitrophota bacterium]HPS19756.1 hypothetical protein [Candidatus Omnitrophota bacterium]